MVVYVFQPMTYQWWIVNQLCESLLKKSGTSLIRSPNISWKINNRLGPIQRFRFLQQKKKTKFIFVYFYSCFSTTRAGREFICSIKRLIRIRNYAVCGRVAFFPPRRRGELTEREVLLQQTRIFLVQLAYENSIISSFSSSTLHRRLMPFFTCWYTLSMKLKQKPISCVCLAWENLIMFFRFPHSVEPLKNSSPAIHMYGRIKNFSRVLLPKIARGDKSENTSLWVASENCNCQRIFSFFAPFFELSTSHVLGHGFYNAKEEA